MVTLQQAIEISLEARKTKTQSDIKEVVETINIFVVLFKKSETSVVVNKTDGSWKFEHRLERIFDDDFNNGIKHKF